MYKTTIDVILFVMQNTLRKIIMIIDDSEDSQTLLTLLLEAHGYHVHCALNGADALVLLRELQDLPDLILLDVQMPVMDGFQFRLQQKKEDRLKNIPVVIMSGDSDLLIKEKMLLPNFILTKPLQIKSLLACVKHLAPPRESPVENIKPPEATSSILNPMPQN
jgi:CheY-like chemotaxis protein